MNKIHELLKTILVVTIVLCASLFMPIAPMWQPILAMTLLVVVLSWLHLKVLVTSVIVALLFMLLPIFIFMLGVNGSMPWYSALQHSVVETLSYKNTWVFSFAGFLPIIVYLVVLNLKNHGRSV